MSKSATSLQQLTLVLLSIYAVLSGSQLTYKYTFNITAGYGSGSLREYLRSHRRLFPESSTRLVLSPGVHNVPPFSGIINIRDVTNIALIGCGNKTVRTLHYDNGQMAEIWEPEAVVRCIGYLRTPAFTFYNVTNLTVQHITFSGCGGSTLFSQMTTFTAPSDRSRYQFDSALAFVAITNLYLGNILVEDTVIGYDIIFLNVLGQSAVSDVHVLWRKRRDTFLIFDFRNFLDLSIESVGGNVMVAYKDYYECQVDVVGVQMFRINSLSIFYLLHENSTTLYSKSRKGAGLNVVMSSCAFNVRLYITDYKYYAHTVGSTDWKANLYQRSHTIFILTFDTAFNFNIILRRFSRIDSIAHREVATIGMVVNRKHIARYGDHYQRCSCPYSKNRIELENIELSGYHHIGIQVHIYRNRYLREDDDKYLILFEDVRLVEVDANYPFVIAQVDRVNMKVVFDNVTIENSTALNGQCIVVEGVTNITLFNDCSFLNNLCTALHNLNSEIVFLKNNTFFNNSGRFGGGMLVEGLQSYVLLAANATLIYTKNHASLSGGAIHVSNRGRVMYCFIRPFSLAMTATIHFYDNTAGRAGSTLWGADLDKKNCERVDLVIEDHNANNSLSVISSSPQHVCYCNASILCATDINGTQQNIFPGQDVKIEIALAGESEGLVPGQVRAEIISDSLHDTSISLSELQTIQEVKKAECVTLIYSFSLSRALNSKNKDFHLQLSPLDSTDLESPIIYEYSYLDETISRTTVHILRVPVTLKPCPLGFELERFCTCLQQLFRLILNATCDINTQTVERTATLWMNASYTGNNTQILAVHQHCPFDYCDHNKLRVDLSSPDQQCTHNRAGVLCGGCKTGLSLTLGSPKCRHCSNNFLSLLLAFVAAGLALVAMLTCLNLTVSVGTINALILYANIVRALNPIFFPSTTFLSVFVAWLNLDFGLNSCFYDGLEFYSLTWLQFVFPVYIWLLVSVMILTSHYSTTAAKLVSRDAVKVLATLFLLSYAKLLRTILTVLSFTYISYEDTNGATHRTAVWLYDGNVEFARGKHIVLVLVAVSFGVLFIIPFTALLLFAPFLQTRSHHYTILKWVNKLMPFLDAYQGPYTKRFRFWPGVLLLVRVVLFVSFAANGLGDPQLNLMFTVTILVGVLTLLWVLGTYYEFGVLYKDVPKNLLEMFYFINIILLSTWSLLQVESNSSKTQNIVSSVFIGLAFCVFSCIVGYHTYLQLKELKLLIKILTGIKERVCPLSETADIAEVSEEQNSTTSPSSTAKPAAVPATTFIELREPLLTEQ